MILRNFFKHCANPQGFLGRVMLRCMNAGHEPQERKVRALIDWQKDWHVLDIGCGGGRNIAEILKLVSDGKVVGVDISDEALSFSFSLNQEAVKAGNCEFFKASVHQLPFELASFDCVCAFETVYFWGDLKKAFSEVLRVIKPHGQFLIFVECTETRIWDKVVPGMVAHSAEGLRLQLLKVGFEYVDVRTIGNGACALTAYAPS